MTSTYDLQRLERPTNLSNEDIYVTLRIENFEKNGNIQAIYDELRQNNLLNYPASKYKVALTNLSIPMTQTYLNNFIFHNPADVNSGSSITLALYDDQFGINNPLISRKYLDFVPFVITDPLTPGQAFELGRVWFYNQYVISINNAFAAAFNDIITQYNAGGYSPATYAANTNYPQIQPYIVCDTYSSLFYIKSDFKCNVDSKNPDATVDPSTINTSLSPNKVCMQISMNRLLYRYFFSFPAVTIGFNVPEPVDGRSCILRIYDEGYSSGDESLIYYNTVSNQFTSYNPFDSVISANLTPVFYKTYQQVSSTNNFYDIESVVVTGPGLQIRPNFINVPSDPNNPSVSNQGSTVPYNFVHPPIPLELNSFQNRESFAQFIWAEQGEYRFCDIFSNTTFNRLNFVINISTNTGDLYPVLIEPQQSAYITLLFRLK